MSTKRVGEIEKYITKAFEAYREQASKKCRFVFKVQVRWWNQRLPVENMKDLSEVYGNAVQRVSLQGLTVAQCQGSCTKNAPFHRSLQRVDRHQEGN